MRLLAIFILSVIAAAATAGGPRPAVGRVSVKAGRDTAYGTGVLVASHKTHGVVITNWHVIRAPRDSVSVSWHDGTISPGVVVAADQVWDLAAVRVDGAPATPVRLAGAAPRIGERLTIAGYGSGEYLEQAGPVVDYLAPVEVNDFSLVNVKAAARHGDSGGPMFNERGELAGVLFGVHEGETIGPCCTKVATFLEDADVLEDSE